MFAAQVGSRPHEQRTTLTTVKVFAAFYATLGVFVDQSRGIYGAFFVGAGLR
jgi:hypothetical protein